MAVKNINGQQKQAMGGVDRPLMEIIAFAFLTHVDACHLRVGDNCSLATLGGRELATYHNFLFLHQRGNTQILKYSSVTLKPTGLIVAVIVRFRGNSEF
jgi:hypothetical protein